MQTVRPTYFPALTGIRALAAYLVFISHYDYVADELLPAWLTRFFHEFHIGVTIFFVLSGFLITYRYYNNFQLTGTWFRKYLKNRVARIYPMYFILTTAAFVYWHFTKDPVITKDFPHPAILYLMNIFFIRGFFSQLWDTGIAQGWSLTVEECFYFAAPFIFYLATKYKKIILQPLAITAFGWLLVLVFRNADLYGFFGNFTFMMLFTFFGRCFEFFAGMALALLIIRKGFHRADKIGYTYLGYVAIFVLVAIMSRLPIPKGSVAGLQHPAGIVINNYLIALAIAIFFYGLLTEDTWLKRFLSFPLVQLLGKASYIFYLIHLGYIYLFFHNWFDILNEKAFELYDKWGKDWASPFQFGLLNLLYGFIILNIISILLYKFIEEPLNHYIRRSRFLENPKKPTV